MNKNILEYNLILDVDSYKFGHPGLYPEDMIGMHDYGEARIKGEVMVPAGIAMWIQKTLLTPITTAMVDEAEALSNAHVGPDVFDRTPWDYIVKQYNGYMPFIIHAVPEGMPVASQTSLYTIDCLDPKLFWLGSYLETTVQRGIWYPTTIASNDRKNWLALKKYYDAYSDNPSMLEFSLHDFGGRGVTSEETAQIGGFAHLIYFMGSDTVSGVRAANFYYNSPMSAFSVVATQHSIQCSFGNDNQRGYLKRVLDKHAKPGKIVSIVIDGYDVYREANLLCTAFKDQIVKSGAKIVFRPDSGDALKIIPKLLKMQEDAFGFTVNSKGKKVINNVGIIQGDGIDHAMMIRIMDKVVRLGYAPESVIYGSGGALLQKVDRDTYKFAQKAANGLFKKPFESIGKWVGIFKDPITDPGKKSKSGNMTTANMVKFYEYDANLGKGVLLVHDDLETIRKRAKSNLD